MSVSALRRREFPASPWAALALIVVAQFMVILDVAIVNVALPSIETDLGFTQSGLEWVVTAYAIVFGGFLLLGGRLADVLGRRRIFAAGIALFAVSSVLCGLSWSAGSLVAFRGLQGLGGALLAPAGLSLLMTTFAEGRDRNVALGIWGAASGSGAAVGVLVGGVLTSYLSWPWIFFVNAPVAAVLLLAVPLVLRESVVRDGLRHFDLAGALSATGAVVLFVYALTLTTSRGWADPVTLSALGASLALAVAFVLNERRAPAPLLPLRMFRIRTFAVGNAVTTIVASIAFSEFFLLTLYLQDVLGYSAVETGLAFSAVAVTIAAVSNVAQWLVTRFGPRGVLTVGLVLVTASLVLIARLPVPGDYPVDLLGPFVLNGVGLALCFIPVTIAGLAGVPSAQAGAASGLLNTSRQVGGAVGLAVVNTIAASSVADGTSSQAHGFRVSLLVLSGMALLGAVLSSTLLARSPAAAAAAREPAHAVEHPVREAA
ncbi:MAG TPA: DHA2 family efflux MFS transporter permease subunit [Gaiella sp.]|nr:DHA2 family efflux MFS transporter permease subunit [Gaiella sp.]